MSESDGWQQCVLTSNSPGIYSFPLLQLPPRIKTIHPNTWFQLVFDYMLAYQTQVRTEISWEQNTPHSLLPFFFISSFIYCFGCGYDSWSTDLPLSLLAQRLQQSGKRPCCERLQKKDSWPVLNCPSGLFLRKKEILPFKHGYFGFLKAGHNPK